MAATACDSYGGGYGRSRAPLPPPLLQLQLGAAINGASSSKAPTPPLSRHHPGLCTEGLGSESSESSGDLDLTDDTTNKDDAGVEAGRALPCKHLVNVDDDDGGEDMAVPVPVPNPPWTRSAMRAFPPPISVIGASGKPWLYLRAHRGDGRLVIREVMIPSRELLQARREDGRLKLHFANPDEEGQELDDAMIDARADAAEGRTELQGLGV